MSENKNNLLVNFFKIQNSILFLKCLINQHLLRLWFCLFKNILKCILKASILLFIATSFFKYLSANSYVTYFRTDIKIKVCIPEKITLETSHIYTKAQRIRKD